MKKVRILSLLLVIVMVMSSFVGCGGNTPAEKPAASGDGTSPSTAAPTDRKLVVGIDQAANSFSPVNSAAGNAEYLVTSMVYETLGTFDDNMELKGICAKDWKRLDEEGYEYEIEIYDYIKDIDGNPITVDDILLFYDLGIENKYAFVTRYVESYEKLTDYTFKVRLISNTSDSFPSVLTSTRVFSAKAYQESADGFATRPIGTTSYRLTEFEPGGNIVLTKVDTPHWQTDTSKLDKSQYANVDEVKVVPIVESSQQSIQIETGEIDMMRGMNAAVLPRFEGNDDYKIFSYNQIMGRILYFSGEAGKPTADNVKLRQALCYAIDTQGIVDVVLAGRGTAEKSHGSNLLVGYNQKWMEEDYYDYNPEKAKQLLKEAGYEEGELTLTFLTLASDEWNKVAQVVQAYLLDIGVNVKIEAYEGALFGTLYNDGTKFDITLDQIGGNFLHAIFNSKMGQAGYGGKTKTGFVDNELEALIQTCRYDSATAEDFDALHYYLKDQAYALGLYDPVLSTVARKDSGIKELAYDYKMMNLLNATVFED